MSQISHKSAWKIKMGYQSMHNGMGYDQWNPETGER